MQKVNAVQNNTGQSASVLQRIKRVPPVAYMLIVIIAAFSFMDPHYLSFSNFRNVLIQATPLMIVAFGQTCIVLTQGTDLSLGAQVSFVTVFTVFLAQRGIILEVAMLISIVCTMLIGALNGLIVAKGNIPPFIATYGMQNIVNSISLLLTAGSSIFYSSFTYRVVTETTILFIPLMVWVAAAVFIVVWIVLRKTKFGTNIYGLGGNREALVLAGISPVKCLIKTYAFAGMIAGIAGVITLCRVESGQPIVATGWEFQAVAATLLGGTSLREGKGGVTGTIFGVLLIRIIKNGLNVIGVQSIFQNAIIGSIVLAAIIIDAVVRIRSKE
ncbi:ABC transporter permease [Bariatricus massiliensis]|uniref:ABC transporter permease n=1 Tax=Bariatricus massiliensis TaxID=1745713 RepID=A0ABS8DGK9_9FIRM|nr:ABC transporter permease [Bariatricus massiliensis]MCB7304395.1 ABC transporter permease [Bariatricus massiliensis]MCB7375046.1 ABC transporter permease [Bariatricus massiliensis]MCB7387505.1 ABC transporter permease [Bariatricus massiliensis]MCB7411667.1 ABC transporter permease [Bariatricus massiliensis]MCQ5253802.1 ABC transporter permease [Bariatricus massiliensis]